MRLLLLPQQGTPAGAVRATNPCRTTSWRSSSRDYIAGNDAQQVEFEWQGGEPTLLGIEFFRKVVDLQQKHCGPNKRVVNSLQTNGMWLDE